MKISPDRRLPAQTVASAGALTLSGKNPLVFHSLQKGQQSLGVHSQSPGNFPSRGCGCICEKYDKILPQTGGGGHRPQRQGEDRAVRTKALHNLGSLPALGLPYRPNSGQGRPGRLRRRSGGTGGSIRRCGDRIRRPPKPPGHPPGTHRDWQCGFDWADAGLPSHGGHNSPRVSGR